MHGESELRYSRVRDRDMDMNMSSERGRWEFPSFVSFFMLFFLGFVLYGDLLEERIFRCMYVCARGEFGLVWMEMEGVSGGGWK